jgi:hypothetical protein
MQAEFGSRVSPTAYGNAGRDAIGHNKSGYRHMERSNGQHKKPHVDFKPHPSDLLGVGGLFD